MENWKRALFAGSAGLSVICLLKGNRTGGLIFGGVALATLASEYPEKFAPGCQITLNAAQPSLRWHRG